jgi:hypothetical protein
MEPPSNQPPCCPNAGAKEDTSRHDDNEEGFDGINPDFSELMDFEKTIGGELTTSGMVLSHVEKAIDSWDMDLYPFSSDTPRSDSDPPLFKQSGGAPTHSDYTPLSNRSDNGSGPGLQEFPLLGSSEFSVFEQQQSCMSLDNISNQRSPSDAVEEQNLPRDTQNLPVPNVERHELVDSVCGSPLRSSNSRTIITLDEADQNTVMEMMNIALRSNAKVRFENY